MYIIFIVLAIISLRTSSGLDAEDTSYLLSGSVLSGGEYVGNDLLTSTCQARPVNSSLQKEQKLNPFDWAVTSFQENNTALAVCFRQKEIRARKYLLKYLISIEIINNTKQRDSKISMGAQEKPKTLFNQIDKDPSQNQSKRYLIRVSGLNTTLRAVHILEYSAHAVCFWNETVIESIEGKKERKNDERMKDTEIYLRGLHQSCWQNTPKSLSDQKESKSTQSKRYLIRVSGLNTTLRAVHILEYSAHAVCFRDTIVIERVVREEERKNEVKKNFEIYLRGLQQNYQRKGTNADLPKRTMKREDGCNLSKLVLKEERLTNNLWADKWKHSALAVCFLFYGKEKVENPQVIKLIIDYNTNHRDELYACVRELVLYLVKEMQMYHPKLNRSQRRRRLKSKTYKMLVYRERVKRSKSIMSKLRIRTFRLYLTIMVLYLIIQSLIRILKLRISIAAMKSTRSVLMIIVSCLNKVREMIEEESAKPEKVEEENRERFEIFVRDLEGRTTVIEVSEDEIGEELIKQLIAKKPNLENTGLRLSNGPNPLRFHISLRDQGVKKGDTLEIQLELSGGMKPVRTRSDIIAAKKLLDEQNASLEKEMQEAEEEEERAVIQRAEKAEKEREENEKKEKERAEREERAREKAEASKVNKSKGVTFGDLEEVIDDLRKEINEKVPKEAMSGIFKDIESNASERTQLKELIMYLENTVARQEKKITQQEETIQQLWSDMKELRVFLKEKEMRKPEEKVKSIQPMTKLNIAKYSKDQDWKDWQKDFEFEAMIGQWTEAQKLSNLMFYLSDDIRNNCKEMTKEQVQSYDQVIALLMNNYGTVKKRTRLEYEREFLNLTMSPSTPVTNFMQSIKNMAKLAEIDDDARIVERFTEGLRPKEVLSATRRVCKEKKYTMSEEVLKAALEEQQKYLEEKQLLDFDTNNSPKTNCKSCKGELEKGEILFCKSCKEAYQKKGGKRERPDTRVRLDTRKSEDKEREEEILKKKPTLGLKHEELREQERCFYCTEKFSEHSARSCRDKYPDMRPYQVREKLKRGEIPDSKNEGGSRTPKASGS